jgi:hypothetical protein
VALPVEKVKSVTEQTRELKDEFVNSFKDGTFDNVIPEQLIVRLKKKIPQSEELVDDEAGIGSNGQDVEDGEDSDEGEESTTSQILFEIGNSLSDFALNFQAFSPNQKAQLCLTDPPWGLLNAAKHQHDVTWTKEEWNKFAVAITKSMNDDGVI